MRAVLVVVLAALVGGALWLDSLFEEPAAVPIESLAAELDARVLLAVLAHPDDEIMIVGALDDAVRRGVRVHVITATRGENGTPDVDVARGEPLAQTREAELREHARLLGFVEQLVWRFPDREVDRHVDEAAARIGRELERIRPDVVLTFHPGSGFTYHPDHRAVGAATERALAETAVPARLVHAVAPLGVMRVLGGEPGAAVAAKQPPATHSLSIDPALKRRGWRIHASQAGYVRRAWKVPTRVLYVFFDEEHYRVPDRGGR